MLTVQERTLAEAHGLAIAASETVDRVEERIADRELLARLDELRLDAREVRGRCLDVESEEQLGGQVAPGFEEVRDEFDRNFVERGRSALP